MKRLIITVSGISRAGKTETVQGLLETFPCLQRPVTTTTRAPRPKNPKVSADLEVSGVDYHFKDHVAFQRLLADGHLIEWDEYDGNFYGLERAELDKVFAQGKIPIINLTLKGVDAVRNRFPGDVFSLFIVPRSLTEVEARMRKSGMNEGTIAARLAEAQVEMQDYIVVCDQALIAGDGEVPRLIQMASTSVTGWLMNRLLHA